MHPDAQQQPYTRFSQQTYSYQGYEQQMPYAGMQRPISQKIPSYTIYAQPYLNR